MARVTGGVEIEGLNAKVRALQSLGLEVNDLKDAFEPISREAAALVSSYAPKQSGALAGSVRGNRAKNKAIVRAGKSAVPWAGPINFGWPARNIPASNFMQKGDADYQPRAVSRLEDEIENQIRKKGLA